ncbi:MAG: Rab family GTPase [Promethearchaeota archaeon]
MPLYVFKVIIIGPGAVGKTSLLHRYVENKFHLKYKLTIGADFLSKIIEGYPTTNSTCKLQIWDIGGQERYKFLRSSFFDGANGALVVFDVSRWHTFEDLKDWITDLRQYAGEKTPLVLIGNKVDLCEDNEVGYEKIEAKSLAKRENAPFIETSAKTGENVEAAFLNLTDRMIKNISVK